MTPFQPRLSDRLSAIAIAIDSGNGEAQIAWAAAERIDELEARLRDVQAAALYLRSTMAQVESLLNGDTQFGMPNLNPLCMAKIKAGAALRAVAEMDLGNIKGEK